MAHCFTKRVDSGLASSHCMEERRLRLEAEGHSVTPARSGVSYQVANYLDHMFDLNLLRDEMPLKQDAAIIRMI